MITHRTMIHAKCPINDGWDYYTVEVTTDQFIKCEDIEAICNCVRGRHETQEAITTSLREYFASTCKIKVIGRHGQNTETIVEM